MAEIINPERYQADTEVGSYSVLDNSGMPRQADVFGLRAKYERILSRRGAERVQEITSELRNILDL